MYVHGLSRCFFVRLGLIRAGEPAAYADITSSPDGTRPYARAGNWPKADVLANAERTAFMRTSRREFLQIGDGMAVLPVHEAIGLEGVATGRRRFSPGFTEMSGCRAESG